MGIEIHVNIEDLQDLLDMVTEEVGSIDYHKHQKASKLREIMAYESASIGSGLPVMFVFADAKTAAKAFRHTCSAFCEAAKEEGRVDMCHELIDTECHAIGDIDDGWYMRYIAIDDLPTTGYFRGVMVDCREVEL